MTTENDDDVTTSQESVDQTVMDPGSLENGALVQPGDTWAVAAERLGVDVDALVMVNGGVSARPLIVGEGLVLP